MINHNQTTVQGTIRGNSIVLTQPLGFADGETVTVIVQHQAPRLPENYEQIVRRLSGAWSDEGAELDEYLRTCRQETPGERPELEP